MERKSPDSGERSGIREPPIYAEQFCISEPLSDSKIDSAILRSTPMNSLAYYENKKSALCLLTPFWMQMCYHSLVNGNKYILSQLLKLRITAAANQVDWLFKKGGVKTKKDINTGFDETE